MQSSDYCPICFATSELHSSLICDISPSYLVKYVVNTVIFISHYYSFVPIPPNYISGETKTSSLQLFSPCFFCFWGLNLSILGDFLPHPLIIALRCNSCFSHIDFGISVTKNNLMGLSVPIPYVLL